MPSAFKNIVMNILKFLWVGRPLPIIVKKRARTKKIVPDDRVESKNPISNFEVLAFLATS